MIHIHITGPQSSGKSKVAAAIEKALNPKKAFNPAIRNYAETEYQPTRKDRENLAKAGVEILITTEQK